MTSSDRSLGSSIFVRITLVIMMLAFLFLGVKLWRVQVLNTSKYADDLRHQSIRLVRLPGSRGRIFDRNGICLANNRPSYCLVIYSEELRQPGSSSKTIDMIDDYVHEISKVIGVPPQVTRRDISLHISKRRPMPFLAWEDIGPEAMARWAENGQSFKGVDIQVRPVRQYPLGSLAAHVVGYVGRRDNLKTDADDAYKFFLPDMEGKSGIERTCNSRLSGKAGVSSICVDASMFKHHEKVSLEPAAGEDITLTIDSRIQRLLEDSIGDDVGAGVVVDPRNGDILAMTSSPSFDCNKISSNMRSIQGRKNHPLINRAIAGIYPPGSTFKPVVAFAALETAHIPPGTIFQCDGYYALGSVRFRCWIYPRKHGAISLRKAIEQSCNAYFCQLGMKTGHKAIEHMALALGLGQDTGICLAGEHSGLIPDDGWKRRVFKDAWRPGDTCNMSIGQGAVLVTPLQLSLYTATIANKGFLYKPRLLKESDLFDNDKTSAGTLVREMHWSEKSMSTIRGGMFDVVEAVTGSGKRAKVDGVHMAGKTGTAEYGKKGEGKKHTWMILFAPFEHPRYAVAIVIENGLSGGRTVAPKIHALMEGIFSFDGTKAPVLDNAHSGISGGQG